MEEIELIVEVVRREAVQLRVSKGVRVEEVIKLLGLNSEEYVAVLDGRLVPEDEVIERSAKLKLVPVVSGG